MRARRGRRAGAIAMAAAVAVAACGRGATTHPPTLTSTTPAAAGARGAGGGAAAPELAADPPMCGRDAARETICGLGPAGACPATVDGFAARAPLLAFPGTDYGDHLRDAGGVRTSALTDDARYALDPARTARLRASLEPALAANRDAYCCFSRCTPLDARAAAEVNAPDLVLGCWPAPEGGTAFPSAARPACPAALAVTPTEIAPLAVDAAPEAIQPPFTALPQCCYGGRRSPPPGPGRAP